jgi:hypothetical protein
MALSWSARRQFLYYAVAAVIGLIILGGVYQAFFTTVPTCRDGLMNGTELGVDCGGTCSLVCENIARNPRVLWARSFPTGPNAYTAAAYIENSNPGAGARSVQYSFRLFDANSVLVVERDGITDLPPTTLIPIVETGIDVGQRQVARTIFTFAEVPIWNTIGGTKPDLKLSNQTLNIEESRLSATLVNNALTDAGRVSLVAVLFDVDGVARAASKTTVNVLRKSSQPIVFTWPQGIESAVRAEITILPSF